MFIRLGNTKVNYRTASTDKYMIFSEVVNSSLSYETPIVINSIAELNALFSKDFEDYIYLKRLLENYKNVGLYLFKPLSPSLPKYIMGDVDYIDYSNYTVIDPYIFTTGPEYVSYYEEFINDPYMAIPVFKDEKDYSKGVEYKFLNKAGSWQKITKPETIFKGEAIIKGKDDVNLNQFKTLRESKEICIKADGKLYVYTESFGFIEESLLPQNMGNLKNSESLDNRSTLYIPIDNRINYVHPEYRSDKGLGIYSHEDSIPKLDLNYISAENIQSGRETLALRVSGNKTSNGTFAFITNYKGSKHTIVITTNPKDTNNAELDLFDTSVVYRLTELENLENTNLGFGLKVVKDGDDFIIYGLRLIDVGYNTMSGVTISADYELSQSIIYNSLENTKTSGVEVWSKTIGGTSELDEDGIIKIQIEQETDTEYIAIISRYDYQEVFEGTLVGIDRLDYRINKESKLVYMKFLGDEIKTGTFYMSRGKYDKNSYNNTYWMNSLKAMFGDESRDINSDFLLIPDIQKYVSKDIDRDLNYYKEYLTILDYCKTGNFQALIQNKKSEFSYIETTSTALPQPLQKNTIYHLPGNELSPEIEEKINGGNSFSKKGGFLLNYDINSLNFYINGSFNDGKRIDDVRRMYVNPTYDGDYVQIDYDFRIFEGGWPDKTSLLIVNESDKYELDVHAFFKYTFTIESANLKPFIFHLKPGESKVFVCDNHGDVAIYPPYLLTWTGYSYGAGYYKVDNNGNVEKITDISLINKAIYGGDFCYNYLDDKENRLIYFYESIYTRTGKIRYPGYCIFIDGIMTGNYSGDVEYILYNTPVNNPYAKPVESIENTLEKFRCNYLVFNGLKYYYKKYFEPKDRITSIFLRFILGKVTRELYKRKSYYIGQKNIGIVKQDISDLLLKVESSFSIVDHITLYSFESDLQNNRLNIILSTAVKNLVDKDIMLNITLNLNK